MANQRTVIGEMIALRAERRLKEVAMAICDGWTAEGMEEAAQKNLTLAELVRQTGYTIPKVSMLARPGVNHLARLSDEEILHLLEEVVPENVAVLRRHPNFCHSVIRDLKALTK
mgnify:CR=1 FL=1